MGNFIGLNEIKKASQILQTVVIESPFQKIESYSQKYNSNIFFKREDLQKVRSFKIRGAFNKISSLNQSQVINGIVCASAGNHAQGFAVSCSTLGYKGKVFMPTTTPNQKIEQVKKFGKTNVEVVLFGENFTQAYEKALQECDKYDKTFIHPFDDKKVIAGQATLFLEIINQFKDHLDYLFIPIGGGGLISGAINVFKQLSPNTKIVGIEPKGAPSMSKSIEKNKLITISHTYRHIIRVTECWLDDGVCGGLTRKMEEVCLAYLCVSCLKPELTLVIRQGIGIQKLMSTFLGPETISTL